MSSLPAGVSDHPSLSSFWMDEMYAILAALQGGARYGFKIRVPHALVMTFLFKNELSALQKIRAVTILAAEHAGKLAAFATIYKTILVLFKRASRHLKHSARQLDGNTIGKTLLALIIDGPFHHQRLETPGSAGAPAGHPERSFHSFVAGCIGGYCVWGNSSSINNQVLLYLVSRIQMALVKKVWERCNVTDGTTTHHPDSPSILRQHPWLYRAIAATAWGMVMALFEDSPHVLHSSLKSSMDEIYRYPSLLSSSSSSLEDAVTTTVATTSSSPGYDTSIPQ